MNILVACEESQRVCIEFRRKGHNAFSCDIMECSGGHPEWHITGDVLPLLNGRCTFTTMDGTEHSIDGEWDMIIAFPPCTHLANSGARHFARKRENGEQEKAIRFFAAILAAECVRIAIENPMGIISGEYLMEYFPDLCREFGFPIKPSQIIQPYEHGDAAKKTTCVWLKNLAPLVPTNIVDPGEFYTSPDGRKFSVGASADTARDEDGKIIRWNDPRTAKLRSKTFPGIAKAMAEQWG